MRVTSTYVRSPVTMTNNTIAPTHENFSFLHRETQLSVISNVLCEWRKKTKDEHQQRNISREGPILF